ncbi:MAG: DUF1461 domain-containing protein [Clostridiales bacterium]|nr:DUF1461 domain-containing protein [Bacillota bacterium]NLL53689.1 DUF1461 domain-containing protein [Clostridiales bacterium]
MRKSACVFLALFLLSLSSLYRVGADTGLHLRLYKRQQASLATGLRPEGVERAARALTKCLTSGDTGHLTYRDHVYDRLQPVFNEKEIAHMGDVAHLFALLKRVVILLGCSFLLLFLWSRASPSPWPPALVRGAALFLGLSALLILGISWDFAGAFLLFHRLLFANELWLMDPTADLIIRLMPQPFFEALAGRFALLSALWPLLALTTGLLLQKRRPKKRPMYRKKDP